VHSDEKPYACEYEGCDFAAKNKYLAESNIESFEN
jgi:hypothetical protein